MYYVAHRLFGLHDRMVGALLADELGKLVGPHNVFLPFCDTDEEQLQSPLKGKRLFELDKERLEELTGMIAVLHGPSLDDGVCVEVGYAARCGVPIVAFTTDFQTYGVSQDGREIEFPEPLLEVVCRDIVRAASLSDELPALSEGRLRHYYRRNSQALDAGIKSAASRLVSAVDNGTPTVRRAEAVGNYTFVEPSPYTRGGGASPSTVDLGEVVQASRYSAAAASTLDATIDAARRDWESLLGARRLLVDVSGPETPAGAALMVGAAHAGGTEVWAWLDSVVLTYAPGREPNRRNLMVHYAIDRWLADG